MSSFIIKTLHQISFGDQMEKDEIGGTDCMHFGMLNA
jgi:hypothetical protein